MKKFLLLLMISFSHSLFSGDNFVCISLGNNCTVRASLENFEFTKAAYPFDWLVTSFSALYATLEDDFEKFLNPAHLKMISDKRAIQNKYGLIFKHDFPTATDQSADLEKVEHLGGGIIHAAWLTFLPEVKKKYDRRIARFREQCMSGKKVYFFRHFDTTRQQACALRDLIQKLYPTLNFTLVVIGNTQAHGSHWGEPKIRNYFLNDTVIWNDVGQWKSILVDLGILAAPQ